MSRNPGETKDSHSTPAFVNVNVIPMDSERILEGHTVVVKNGKITAMGPVSNVRIPENTYKIDATGKYLLPGLADMHVHNWSENEFILVLANGVTTIRYWKQECSQSAGAGNKTGIDLIVLWDINHQLSIFQRDHAQKRVYPMTCTDQKQHSSLFQKIKEGTVTFFLH